MGMSNRHAVSEGLRSREKFRAITTERWKNLNEGKCPKEAGMLVKYVKGPGSKSHVECVLVRKKPDGEWDLELDVDTRVLMREEVDDGQNVLRAGQQKPKFEALGDSIMGGVRGDVKSIDEEAYKNIIKSEKAAPIADEDEAGSVDEDEEENEVDHALSDLIPNLSSTSKKSQAEAAIKRQAMGIGRLVKL